MTKEYAIQILREMIPKFARCDTDVKRLTAINMAINSLAERKTGKWKTNSDFPDRLICSECSAQFDMWHWEAEQMHYCPKCGARMEGTENESCC